jgi:hypothetical protein
MNQPDTCGKGCETCGRWCVTPDDCGQDCFKGNRWVAQRHSRTVNNTPGPDAVTPPVLLPECERTGCHKTIIYDTLTADGLKLLCHDHAIVALLHKERLCNVARIEELEAERDLARENAEFAKKWEVLYRKERDEALARISELTAVEQKGVKHES